MSSRAITKQRIQLWQLILCAGVCGYIALAVSTHTIRSYHWFMLAVIPAAVLTADRGRQFFLDWAPLIAFWLVYDRLRLLQPFLLNRVSVETPYALERWAFGWLAGGQAPAHAARAWLASSAGEIAGPIISWAAQLIYLSHIFAAPILLIWLWARGKSSARDRERFARYVIAFSAMSFMAIIIYLLLPVAPPWWVSLHGIARPTPELLAQTRINAAMDGALIQGMIKNAAQWFAAVPSLHGAYPALLFLLGLRDRSRLALALIFLYGAAMWAATVILNQHYIIDLMAGALIAVAAWRISPWIRYPERIEPSKTVV